MTDRPDLYEMAARLHQHRSSIMAMTPAEFRAWSSGKHSASYSRERQWRTDDRNARKLAAKEAGQPWTRNDPRVDDQPK